MKSSPDGVVAIVGAGLAGSRVASELRRVGHLGPIVLIGEEAAQPYDRPPLSKAVLLGKREPKPLKVDYAGLDITLRLDTRVEAVDLATHTVHTTGASLGFDHLVVATGATPVRLPGSGPQLTLRTDRDALALRAQLVEGARVVLIGASWIGAEVAHAALRNGCIVTALEFHPAPFTAALGTDIGARFTPWWPEGTLRTDARVRAVEPDGVHLFDGEIVPADVVVSGIGVRAASEWLAGTGLELLPAVAVDERLRTGDPAVYALGDVAASWSPRLGRRLHVQHWDNAHSAASVVAGGIVFGPTSELVHDPVPYFWSEQFGHRIEYVGQHEAGNSVTVMEDLERGWLARWTDDRGRLTAALGVDESKLVLAARHELAATSTPPQTSTKTSSSVTVTG